MNVDPITPDAFPPQFTRWPLCDNLGYITLVDWMGGDEDAVQRARDCYNSWGKATPEKNEKLARKLIGDKPMHGTTTRGTVLKFKVKLPLFVREQLTRHLAGHVYESIGWSMGTHTMELASAYDQMSLRYVDARTCDYYNPATFRSLDEDQAQVWMAAQKLSISSYEALRQLGLTQEIARCFIPQNIYTEMNWTTNFQAIADWAWKRMPRGGAQSEHTAYAVAAIDLMETFVSPIMVDAWKREVGWNA
ncbi:Thymidylate synthase ThyX-like protein [Virus Rctr71]|nr:Thymidylate synthase ThyX-like protein [Virus Rctr71]